MFSTTVNAPVTGVYLLNTQVIVTTGLLGRNVFIVLALGRFAPSGLVQ